MELIKLKGVGNKVAQSFNKKGINSIEELYSFYPINYNVFSNIEDEDVITENKKITVTGIITKSISEYKTKNNLLITTYFISNGKNDFKIIAFNQRHLRFTLKQGMNVRVQGKYDVQKKVLTQSSVTILDENNLVEQNIFPIYSKVNSLTSKQVHKIILKAIELLPDGDLKDNLLYVHNPNDFSEIKKGQTYFKYLEFEEYYKKLKNLQNKQKVEDIAFKKNINLKDLDLIYNKLPFELTNDQQNVTNTIVKSLNSNYLTQTLILGDVGSGKTIISIILAFLLTRQGYQVAIMAPTEVLAKQLFENYKTYLEDFDINISYLSSALNKVQKNKVKDRILLGLDQIIIGTHALIQNDVEFSNLAICFIDEQHRFGVEQRNLLIKKTQFSEFIYMSATPIPRTLAQSMFGVIDVEFIKTKPKGRKKIVTKVYTNKDKKEIFNILDTQLKNGHLGYVVAPAIEESEDKNLANVEDLYESFSKYYNGKYSVGILHGSLKSKNREIIMEKFKNKEFQILVCTTVIEVGVDIPEATVMIIVNAERFGLSALHQLRGRVGRSDAQGYCLLYDKSHNVESKERLKLLEQYDDGFILANKDLELRGYGNFFGKQQSGFADFKLFDYINDYDIAQRVIEKYNQNT